MQVDRGDIKGDLGDIKGDRADIEGDSYLRF